MTKVSGEIDEAEAAENKVQPINVPFVHPQTFESKQVNTVLSTHEGQCSMQKGDLKPRVQPTISTKVDAGENGRDRTKTDQGAFSQRATLQQEVKFVTSKPSKIYSVGQYWLPLTNGGNPNGAFRAPQFAKTQKQYLPSQGANLASTARNDNFIRFFLPKLNLTDFFDDPLEWPEWSQLFQATIHAANIDDSMKMNHP